MSSVATADGTVIGYETSGSGPALIFVDGAMCYRDNGPARSMAAALSDRFTVYLYDRRGRGASGAGLPWSARAEVDDLAAVLAVAGGSAVVVGVSSGAVLAADAAARLPGITGLALYEPPFIVDGSRAPREASFIEDMEALLAAGDRAGAVKKFLVHVGVPRFVVAVMPLMPAWKRLTAVAHTLPYDLRILGDTGRGVPLDSRRWADVGVPVLVLDGGKSPEYMRNAARAFSAVLPKAGYRTLPGQTHMVKAAVLGPACAEFLG
ncbi:alpha/beta fold hydrolase [Paractinoplanes ferrugineus]|uniref:Alpha/beta hydrolase n=1 Tax=Paractinoplanes ferrugineus TaxID=113564 RepID=A0A919J2I3_9ACTN|nr:alpha/beta hydrolase [Actinoplanes ferrugineus]GIE12479.1 alpha/beta hydrolase [Actinoplanes ferrugineus]